MHSIIFSSVHKVFRRSGFIFSRTPKIETLALRGVSFEVPRGEVLALLGPNGSGKSTTLKLISTMLLPDEGSILVNGANTRIQSQAVRSQVGFAVAAERSFYPRLTIRENLEFFAALEDVPRRERAMRLNSALENVDLFEASGKQVMKLSSGMYQRLGIARALVKKPSVLLLDEPSRSLDASAANQLWNLIRDLSSAGITIVLATHNFTEAIAVADRIGILRQGEPLGVCHNVGLSEQQLKSLYLQITNVEMNGEREQSWAEPVPA